MNSTMVQLLHKPIHNAHPWGTHWSWSMTLQCNVGQPRQIDTRLQMVNPYGYDYWIGSRWLGRTGTYTLHLR